MIEIGCKPLIGWHSVGVKFRTCFDVQSDFIVNRFSVRVRNNFRPDLALAPVPRGSDTLQLAASALLIEENFCAMPAYGLLKYRDAVLQVELTDELRARLLDTLAAMRRDLSTRDVARSHTEPRRCRACGFRAECEQAL